MQSVTDKVLDCVKQFPGIAAPAIATLLDDHEASTIAAALTTLYKKKKIIRQPARSDTGRRTFVYDIPSKGTSVPTPQVTKHTKRSTTTSGNGRGTLEDSRVTTLEARIAELEAWKADAIERFPELAVDPLVLKARQIVAQVFSDRGERAMAQRIQNGESDGSAIMKATIEALNQAA